MTNAEKLCKLAQAGNTDAASQLLRLFYKKIYSYLRRLTVSNANAEDLTQQTFTKVWQNLNSFKGNCTFNSWIYHIAHNTFVDWLRKKRTSTPQQQTWWDSIEDTNPNPLETLEQKQLEQRLYKAVEDLDDDKTTAVHLRYYQHLSIKEIAFVLDIAASTVKYRLKIALKELKVALEQNEVQKTNLSFRKNKYA